MKSPYIDQSLNGVENTQISLEKIRYYQHKAHVERSMNFHRLLRRIKGRLSSST